MTEAQQADAKTDIKAVGDQYRNSSKLQARANLHIKYGSGEPWWPWVADSAALPEGAEVLEIGCGPGWMWEGGEGDFPRGLKIRLTDISQGMVDEAMARARKFERYSSVSGETADAVALPFGDQSFDAVLACHMMYHVSDVEKAFDEIKRVLRPGGIVAVTTNGPENLKLMYELGGTAFGGYMNDPAGEAFGFRDAERLMNARFTNVVTTYCPGELAVTDGEAMVDALTSFPPGDTATDAQLAHLRKMIATHMSAGNGVMRIPKLTGMVRGVKG